MPGTATAAPAANSRAIAAVTPSPAIAVARASPARPSNGCPAPRGKRDSRFRPASDSRPRECSATVPTVQIGPAADAVQAEMGAPLRDLQTVAPWARATTSLALVEPSSAFPDSSLSIISTAAVRSAAPESIAAAGPGRRTALARAAVSPLTDGRGGALMLARQSEHVDTRASQSLGPAQLGECRRELRALVLCEGAAVGVGAGAALRLFLAVSLVPRF